MLASISGSLSVESEYLFQMWMRSSSTETGHRVGGFDSQGPTTEEIRQLTVSFSLPLDSVGGATGARSGANPANWRLYHEGSPVSDWIDHIAVEGEQATLVFDRPLPAGEYHLLAMNQIRSTYGTELRNSFLVDFEPLESWGTYSPLSFTVPERVTRTGNLPAIEFADAVLHSMQISPSGDLAALFQRYTGEHDATLYLQRYDSQGGRRGEPILVSDLPGVNRARLGISDDGGLVVAVSQSVYTGPYKPWDVSHRVFQFDKFGNRLREIALPELDGKGIRELAVAGGGRFAIATDEAIYNFDEQGEPAGSFQHGSNTQVLLIDDQGNLAQLPYHMGYDWLALQKFTSQGEKLGSPVIFAQGVEYSPQFFKLRGDAAVIYYWTQTGHFLQEVDTSGPRGEPVAIAPPHLNINSIAHGPGGRWYLTGIDGSHVVWTEVLNPDGSPASEPFRVEQPRSLSYYGSDLEKAPLVAVNSAGDVTVFWNSIATPADALPINNPALRQFRQDFPPAYIDLDTSTPGVNSSMTVAQLNTGLLLLDPQSLRIASGDGHLNGARVWINEPLPGDRLSVDAQGTNITPSYDNGVLVLSGLASVAKYRRVLQTLKLTSTDDRPAGSDILVRIGVVRRGEQYDAGLALAINANQVVQRRLFHNDSSINSAQLGYDYTDDDVIHSDKSALLPGQTATVANYTGYTHGINGIAIDLAGDIGSIQADDFTFRVGIGNDPTQWALAPAPESVVVRPAAGIDGSHRIMITWRKATITNTWLQVTVLANGNTGLVEPDVFYFGNRVGDTGNEVHRAQPQTTEALRLINLLINEGPGMPLALDDPFDFDRDGVLSTRDLLAVFNAMLARNPPLNMITAPQAPVAASPLHGLATPAVSGAKHENAGDVHVTTVPDSPAGPLAAVFEALGDDDARELRMPLVGAGLLMEEPEEN